MSCYLCTLCICLNLPPMGVSKYMYAYLALFRSCCCHCRNHLNPSLSFKSTFLFKFDTICSTFSARVEPAQNEGDIGAGLLAGHGGNSVGSVRFPW